MSVCREAEFRGQHTHTREAWSDTDAGALDRCGA